MRRRGWAPRELPPRARRIHTPSCLGGGTCGTTSACAENTIAGRNRPRRRGNYLRVRGEYSSSPITPVTRSELPPRARRIPNGALCTLKMKGTTSACAENTCHGVSLLLGLWNYLRVRGEYITDRDHGFDQMELPPRARRIRHHASVTSGAMGTTSACAENTLNELGLL